MDIPTYSPYQPVDLGITSRVMLSAAAGRSQYTQAGLGVRAPQTGRGFHSKLLNIGGYAIKTGWWFGTFFIFHNIWDNPSH